MLKNWSKILLLITIAGLNLQFVRAQETSGPQLVDAFAYSNSEDASVRIDNWRNELNQTPQNRGAVIVYGGQTGKRGEIEAHLRGIKQAFAFKRIEEKRVSIVKGGFREKLMVEFWIIPEGAGLPPLSPTVDLKKVRFKGVSSKIIPYECCF